MWTKGNKKTRACRDICELEFFRDPEKYKFEGFTHKPMKELSPGDIVSGIAHKVTEVASEAMSESIKFTQAQVMEMCVEKCYIHFDDEATKCILNKKHDDVGIQTCLKELAKRKAEAIKEQLT